MKKSLIVLILLIITGFSNLFGSHIPGGNITYECTGNPNEYLITLKLYISCPFTSGPQYNLTASNTCGLANPTVTLLQVGTSQEISSICPSQQNQSACSGGTIPGINVYTFQSIIMLPATCNSWTFAFELCCRNTATNLTGGPGNSMYFETVMNSQTAPCDDSPFITALPSPFACVGITQTYCPEAVDPNGDSLYYQLVNPYGAGGVPIFHNPPYTPSSPLQNFTFDSLTGCITFNEPFIGNYVITYLIQAFNSSGNMTGSIIHDFQFQVINCTNNAPISTGLTLTSGSANQLGPNLLELCEGASTCFDITYSDIDATDTLLIDTALSTLFNLLPGAIINTTGVNPFIVSICWTAPAGAPSFLTTTLIVNDGACPVMAFASQTINFNIIASTVSSADTTICGAGMAQLSVSGGSTFNWTTISGDPILVGTNFSCNPCSNPIASPSVTTTYMVTSNSNIGCDSTDTVTVTIVPDFTMSTFGDSLLCDTATIPIGVNISPPGSYTINWSPGATLDDSTIINPFATPSLTTNYIVSVTSALGCVKNDSVTIFIPTTFFTSIFPGDTTICQGQSLQFNAYFPSQGYSDNFDGGFNPSLWASIQGDTTVGCGSNSGDALHFSGTTSRELITNSINTSSCFNIDFCLFIGNDSSGGAPCENADLNEDVVLSYSTVGPSGPWIVIQTFLTTDWDTGGPYANVWNCFSTAIPVLAQTTSTYFKWDQPSYSACIGCDNWSIDDISFSCSVGTNPYSYLWSPSIGLNDSTLINPIATPATTTNYTFTLIDSISGCSINRSQLITVTPGFILQTTPDNTICVGDSVNFTVATSVPGSYSYLWSPGTQLNDSTIFNPTGTFTTSGVNTFIVTVDNGSCVITDTVIITVNTCTYVNELGESFDINVFPNPNNGYFTIVKPSNLNEPIEIQVLDVTGSLILNRILNAADSSTKIDISENSNGMYFLQLKIGKEKIMKKIIKD